MLKAALFKSLKSRSSLMSVTPTKGECPIKEHTHTTDFGKVKHVCLFCIKAVGCPFYHGEFECDRKHATGEIVEEKVLTRKTKGLSLILLTPTYACPRELTINCY